MKTTVVNIKKEECEVYIGRSKTEPMHFGNPFSYNPAWGIKVKDREASVEAFRDWLNGVAWQDVEPERRQWIRNNIETLRGKKLGCFCKPLACHGDILAGWLNKTQ